MLKNYFKIAFRNLLKFKGYAAINIFGLAIGLTCCMFIIQHLRDEMKHDAHHESLDRLYRVSSSFKISGEMTYAAGSPGPLAWTLVEDFPEVEAATRVMIAPNVRQHLIRKGENSFFEEGGLLADSNFFEILTYNFIEGDAKNALLEPYNVVISQQMARKIFGEERALGQTIRIGDQWAEEDYKVTGVINVKDYPSHIRANFFMNIGSGPIGQHFQSLTEWAGNNIYYTYVRLSPNVDVASLEAKFPALVEEKAGDRLRMLGFEKGHFTEPVKDIYLTSETEYPIGPRGDMSLIYIFAAIAAFILLIACINFMNLSTAKATVRAREVGVRKVIGANRRMLSGQFFTEALVYTLIAVLIAQLLGNLTLPIFNQLAGKELTLNFLDDPQLLLLMGGILLLTALIAGSYPALYLSSFSPVKIFKGSIGDRFSARQIRKGLVLVQFVVSIALIQGIFVVQEQLEYIRHKKLGFEPEAKLVIPLNTNESMLNYPVLKETLLNDSDVRQIGGTSSAPGLPNIEDILVFAEGGNQDASIQTMRNWVDPDFLPMMEFELVAGRFFDENRLADTVVSVVINEGLMKDLGYTNEDVIGKKVLWNWSGTLNTHRIIGVIRDFHSQALHHEISNYMFQWSSREMPQQLVASIATTNLPGLIAKLNENWSSVNANEPFDYFFLDDKLQEAYTSDQRTAGLILAFTLLAIFISCLGLFGLAAFAAESRTKEIGVRKVLGASVSSIVGLISKEFVWLILLAMLIATPVAFFILKKWLQNFHYYIDMPWWAFGLAGFSALAIAFATVSFHSIRAAVANPVNSLRSE